MASAGTRWPRVVAAALLVACAGAPRARVAAPCGAAGGRPCASDTPDSDPIEREPARAADVVPAEGAALGAEALRTWLHARAADAVELRTFDACEAVPGYPYSAIDDVAPSARAPGERGTLADLVLESVTRAGTPAVTLARCTSAASPCRELLGWPEWWRVHLDATGHIVGIDRIEHNLRCALRRDGAPSLERLAATAGWTEVWHESALDPNGDRTCAEGAAADGPDGRCARGPAHHGPAEGGGALRSALGAADDVWQDCEGLPRCVESADGSGSARLLLWRGDGTLAAVVRYVPGSPSATRRSVDRLARRTLRDAGRARAASPTAHAATP